MNRSPAVPTVDLDLERAMAAEAVYAYDRYLAYGISAEDYASPRLQAVVQAAADAWEADGAVDVETVSRALQRAGKLVFVGGLDGLVAIIDSPAVADHEEFVRLRRLRLLRESALAVAAACERGTLDEAITALGDAQTSAIESSHRASTIDVYDLGVRLLEALQQRKHSVPLVHPGWEMLEHAMGSPALGSMIVIGGATNTGKTSYALEGLLRAASRNVTSGFVSCEDGELILSSRIMNAFTGLSSRKLAQGTIDAEDWQRLASGYGPLKRIRGRLKVAFTVGGNEIDVCAAMSRCAMSGAKIVVVDYVQAVESSRRQQDRRNEIRWLCARLKAHAVRLNVVLILLSQLGRPGKGDEFREPTKHDLKEAGDLENAADYVVLLWRESEDDFAPVNVKLAKSKYGNIGTRWKVCRDPRTARLEEVEGSYESAQQRRKRGAQ